MSDLPKGWLAETLGNAKCVVKIHDAIHGPKLPSMEEWRLMLIEIALVRHHGNIAAVAKELKIGRSTLYRLRDSTGSQLPTRETLKKSEAGELDKTDNPLVG